MPTWLRVGNVHLLVDMTNHTNMLWHYGIGTHIPPLATVPLRLGRLLQAVTILCWSWIAMRFRFLPYGLIHHYWLYSSVGYANAWVVVEKRGCAWLVAGFAVVVTAGWNPVQAWTMRAQAVKTVWSLRWSQHSLSAITHCDIGASWCSLLCFGQ